MIRLAPIVVGIDVGGRNKGFHAVALRDGRYHDQIGSRNASDIAKWCWQTGAYVVGVDAPCRWSSTGGARPAERKLMRDGIWCFSTPTEKAAAAHPKNQFDWMLNGAELFHLLEEVYLLFSGTSVPSGARVCFETFPHAITCALAGELVSAKRKATIRRELLRNTGIDTSLLANIDVVDAALCALTAHHFLVGTIKTYGDPETGLIVVPQIRTSPS